MRDLKAIAKTVSEDMSQNASWLERLDGSHNSGYRIQEQGYFNALICELLENVEGEK